MIRVGLEINGTHCKVCAYDKEAVQWQSETEFNVNGAPALCAESDREAVCSLIGGMLNKLEMSLYTRRAQMLLVQSVPEMWMQQGDMMQKLAQAYEKMRVGGLVDFVSRPASVAQYVQKVCCPDGWHGDILVVDCADALEITLCRVATDGSIWVLGSCVEQGCSNQVFLRVLAKQTSTKMSFLLNSALLQRMQDQLERSLRVDASSADAALRDYAATGGLLDSVLAQGEEFSVSASEAAEAFDKACCGAVQDAVKRVQELCAVHAVDMNSMNGLRVVFTGDFYAMHCLEQYVRGLLGSLEGLEDPRFDPALTYEQRLTAAVHGASLNAAERKPMQMINQTTVGIRVFSPQEKKIVELTLIEKGRSIWEYGIPVYTQPVFRAAHMLPEDRIEWFMERKDGKKIYKTEQTFAQLCPGGMEKDGVYRVGMSIGSMGNMRLHIRREDGGSVNVKELQVTAERAATYERQEERAE